MTAVLPANGSDMGQTVPAHPDMSADRMRPARSRFQLPGSDGTHPVRARLTPVLARTGGYDAGPAWAFSQAAISETSISPAAAASISVSAASTV